MNQNQKLIELCDVSVSFDDQKVLDALSLSICDGEFVTLLGPSGCGKTTTLRIIAGFIQPDEGDVYFGSERINGVPPHKRQVNTIFQRYALFPHYNVFDNVAYGLRVKNVPKDEIKERVHEMLRLVNLEGLEHHYPAQLSGGQQQRVALARILCTRPEAILLDEPFSALDSFLKWKLELELSDLLADFHGPILWVSHDRGEVFRNCKRVCVMEQGRSEGVFTLRQLFHEPETEAAARLSGCKNIVEAVPAGNAVTLPQWGLTLDCGKAVSDDVRWAGIRAHHVTAAPEGTEGAFHCAVERVIQDVFTTIVLLRPEHAAPDAPPLRMELEREDAPTVLDNQLVWISVQPRDILLLR